MKSNFVPGSECFYLAFDARTPAGDKLDSFVDRRIVSLPGVNRRHPFQMIPSSMGWEDVTFAALGGCAVSGVILALLI